MKQPSIRQPIAHRRKSLLPMIFKLPSLPLGNLVSSCLVFTLVACGGGGGSGGSNSGQAPDPVVVDLPIAYIQRPIPVDDAEPPVFPDVFAPAAFNPGGELYIKARATAQAQVTNITRAEFENHLEKYPNYTPENPNYDVKDVSAHPDGSRLIFAMRAPLDPNMDEDEEGQPNWNIWEYHLQSKLLRRVIAADFEAEKGHDVAPHYLPDGRILFTSNRQKRSKEILLDEGKPQFGAVTQQDNDITSFLLHSVKDDGTDIQQMTYNQSHDIQPTVMPNGRLLFMRWQGTGQNERLSFYTSNPDGTDIQRYFGYTSLNLEPGDNMAEAPRLFRPQVLPDGRIAAIYLQNALQLGGDMVVVDGATMAEGEVKSISIKPVDISTDHVSLSGRFAALTPLYDGTNRLLVSWSQCRLQEAATGRLQPCLASLLLNGEPVEGYEEAPPFYGIWIYDIASQTQQPVVLAEDGKLFTEAIALEKLAAPPAYIAPQTDLDLAARNLGLLHIRSVYDVDGVFNAMDSGVASVAAMAALPADSRPARFVRILKAVSVPNNDVFNDQDYNIYGNLFNANSGIYEILGYTPVEPDGSVMVTVPSDVAFNLEVLDAKGRRIGTRVDQLISVRPGERLESNGLAIIGRADLALPPLNTGAASFANTQRYLPLGILETPKMGETMAEFAARTTYCPDFPDGTTCALFAGPDQERNLRNPTVDLIYNDEWSAQSLPRTVSFSYRYNDLDPSLTLDTIPAPTPSACRDETSWNANCRVVINYEHHIQPLWERERDLMTVTDPDLAMASSATTCIGCHAPADTDGNLQVPKAQLNLLRTKENDNSQMRAYLQLLNGNQRQVQHIYEGGLAVLLPVCEFEDSYDFIPQCDVLLDAEGIPTCEGVADCPFEFADETTGVLQLDNLGNPVPRMTSTRFLPAPMNRGGANASALFFNKFENNGSHMGFLNAAELKLLSEWLDTNGRYYTNPFELAIPN